MVRFAGKTDAGRRSGPNEDTIGWDAERGVWFVADGMGGHAEGQMASGMVKEALLTRPSSTSLEQAIQSVHVAIQERAHRESQYAGMATTVVCAELHGAVCTIVWVGDSRAYLHRESTLQRITRDHSLMEVLREQQELTPTQIRADPDRHRVTRALGLECPEPSVTTVRLQPGDHLLLCSDGLTDELDDAVILGILNTHSSPETAVTALIGSALEHGGQDNVSAIVVSYDARNWLRWTGLSSPAAIIWPLLGAVALAGALAWLFLRRH